ncbi:MAG: GNAT family N-acetyltransferase [Clostridiales bacterium]|jgi:predicted GNAT family N-acyltransferase|nr:GNAT family N-acetyltransferase [Clostridiales bacterium]
MIKTTWLNGFEDLKDAVMIREKVFVEEQNVPYAEEFDGTDEASMHLVIYNEDMPVATGRILWDEGVFTIGRVAVLKEARGEKYGDFLMRLLIRKAFECGAQRQVIHAQIAAKGFYEKLGFEQISAPYMEAKIPHIDMAREGDIACYCL